MRPVGLYDPAYEHDACGVAFVARLDGVASHETLVRAATALANLEHRGAEGADAGTGDGAGMTLQLPDALFRDEVGPELPPLGSYGVAVCFLPRDAGRATALEQLLNETVEAEGQRVVAWRDVPVEESQAGPAAAATAPLVRQLFVAAAPGLDLDAFERKLYVIRRVAELAAGPDLVIPSFSARTVVYKGMLTAPQLTAYYPDLRDERTASALALVHSRYSTNTFPSWELAHPYRMIAHNGEINTLRGNVNWMRARESQLASELFGDDLAQGPAGRPSRRLGLGDLRQRARAARARRPVAAARDHDDDPRGLPRPRRRLARARRLLRLPPVPAGGLGRPGGDRLHRWAADRRDARPQRPSSRPLARDRRRLDRARLGDGCPRGGAGERRPEGTAAAREALPRRPRAGPDRPGRGGEARRRRHAGRTPSGTATTSCGSTTCPSGRACRLRRSRFASASSPSATRRTT